MTAIAIRKGLGSTISKLSVAGLCLLIGAVLTLPMALVGVIGLLGTLGFIAFCVMRPNAALVIALVALVVVPQYLILHLPGVPALPMSLGPLGVLIAVLVLTAMTSRVPLERAHSNVVTAFAVYGIALLLTTYMTGSKGSFMLLVRTYLIPLMLFFATVYYARSGSSVMRAMNWLLVAACIAALFSVFEFGVKRNDLLEKLVMNAADSSMKEQLKEFYIGSDAFSSASLIYRCFSFFTNPLEFGTFMTMLYPFALVHSVTAEKARYRRLYTLSAVICAMGVVMSFSRGPILAMVLSTVGMAIFLPKLRRVVMLAIVAALLTLALMWPIIGERIIGRLKEVDNVTLRFKFWDVGFRMFSDHPMFGVGLAEYGQYQNDTIRTHRIGPFVESGDIEKVGTVDNHFIQLAAETGIVGLAAYLFLLCVFFFTLYRVWRRHPITSIRNTALALAAGSASYLFNGITITSYVLFVITMILTFFLAASASLDAEVSK